MARKNRPTKESLRELCVAHTELIKIRETQAQRTDCSQKLIEIFDLKLSELEKQFMDEGKRWF